MEFMACLVKFRLLSCEQSETVSKKMSSSVRKSVGERRHFLFLMCQQIHKANQVFVSM